MRSRENGFLEWRYSFFSRTSRTAFCEWIPGKSFSLIPYPPNVVVEGKTVAVAAMASYTYPPLPRDLTFHRTTSLTPFFSNSRSLFPSSNFALRNKQLRISKLLSVTEINEAATSAEENLEKKPSRGKIRSSPFELYVCNLPRSTDISDLLDVFSPYGTVQSVEVSRNPENGLSRGCGFVTMSSILEAKEAVAALDGSELGGREVRVRFSADMASGRQNIENLNAESRKVIFYEGPHKAYVGNLSWSVQPADLRQHFSQFGTVISIKIFRDRKSGSRRVYGFLSFSTVEELQAAILSSGTEFVGRPLLVREVNSKNQQ